MRLAALVVCLILALILTSWRNAFQIKKVVLCYATASLKDDTCVLVNAPNRLNGTFSRSSELLRLDSGNDPSQRRVFVCVTGQVERLLLHVKMATILKPLEQAGYDVDVALILSEGPTFFTNVQFENTPKPEWTSWIDAADFLRQNGMTVVNDAPIVATADPNVSAAWIEHLGNGRAMEPDARYRRAQNHARQFETLTYCDLAIQAEYDWVMRIRDDGGLDPPLNVKGVESILYETYNNRSTIQNNTIMTSDCRSWTGMNDRLAIATPDIASPLFNGPFDRFVELHQLEQREGVDKASTSLGAIQNPESFYYTTYTQQYNATVVQTTILERIMKYTTDSNGTMILGPRENGSWVCDERSDLYREHRKKRKAEKKEKRKEQERQEREQKAPKRL